MKLSNSPQEFLDMIPRGIQENIDFRIKLHDVLAKDEGAQRVFLSMVLEMPQIAFDSCLWTLNPRNKPGFRNLPFILRPKQAEVVNELNNAILNGEDRVVDKSRDEGATELITKLFTLHWLLIPDTMLLVGSRKEEYVDKGVEVANGRVIGDHKCLFHKILYAACNLPEWMKPKSTRKTHMHFENLVNGSVIDGEATNEAFGAGDRRLAVMVDELVLIDGRVAETIRHTLSDVTDCIIYNSTHGPGAGHPYGKLITGNKVKVLTLAWEDNPVKNAGLYKSPDYDIVQIKDVEFYRKKYPGCFDHIMSMQEITVSKLEVDLLSRGLQPDVTFVADGGEANNGGWRSQWYDKECLRRDAQDVARNIDRNPIQSGDRVFDEKICKRIENTTIREPDVTGEVMWKTDDTGRITHAKFRKNEGKCRFAWWGPIVRGRPSQMHNYIVACDISAGTGASNSIASVYDSNTREKVGLFACPNTPPESFADQTIAICIWVGGATKVPYLIWEANGPGGSFYRRVKFHNYAMVYTERNERAKRKTRKNRVGWYNTGGQNGTMYDLFMELRAAYANGLNKKPKNTYLIIHDIETLNEVRDYLFTSTNKIEQSLCSDDATGARLAHGDRVIPDGLFVLALKHQPSAVKKEEDNFEYGSFGWRREQRRNYMKRDKDEWRD